MYALASRRWRAFPLLLAVLAAGLSAQTPPAQVLRFQAEPHPVGGCFSQAGTIMYLQTPPGAADGGQLLRITVHDTVPGQHVLLLFGNSQPWFGGSYLPVFTHGPYLAGPEYFGPWCGWYTNGGVWGHAVAAGTSTSFEVRLPVVPSPALLGDFLWCQAMMSDPTPGWRQGFVTSRPLRLRVVV